MARKQIGTILSSGILMCCVLFMASDVNAQTLGNIRTKQFQISGSVGVPNVVMKGLPGAVITDSMGQYTATVNYNWKGSITPTLAGYEFTPRSRSVSPVKANMPNNDFVGKIQMFIIAGNVGLPNVALNGLPGTVQSDPAGKFQVTVPYGTTLTLVPELEGYQFTPPSIEYSQVNRNYPAQRFAAEKKRYAISGMVSSGGMIVSNVSLKVKEGTSVKEVKTGQDGRYTVEVTHGASVNITPEKDGFTFYPETMSYVDVTASETTNYDATQLRYTIAGNVGVENVLIRYSGGNTLSDAQGNYSIELNHGARVSIKPEKDGWRFSPPELSHLKLVSHLTSQNFQAKEITVTIVGNTGTPGVVLDGLNDTSGQPVISNEQGYYKAEVKYNSTLAVMPMKPGYTFEPASRAYTNVKADQLKETYTAEAMSFEISGNVGLRNVVMVGPQGRFISNPAGAYTVLVPYNWSGTIRPELAGYEFDPPSKSYQNVRENLYSNEDYFAEKKTYTISGLVTSPDGPVENAEIRFGGLGGLLTVTDSQGRYSLQVEHGETGKVSVGKEDYDFDNYSVDVPSMVQNREVSFTGKVKRMKIQGQLMAPDASGRPVPVTAVRLTASNGGTVAVSDAQGRWVIEVPYNWSGQISMEKPGMEIDDVLLFDNVVEDIDLTKPDKPAEPVDPGRNRIEPVETVPGPGVDRTTDDVPPTGTEAPGIMPGDDIFGQLDDPNNLVDPDPGVAPEVQALLDELRQMKNDLARQASVKVDGTGQLIEQGPMVSAKTFTEEELRDVLNLIGDEVGVSIICDVDVLHLTSVSFGDVPLEIALDMLVAGTNFSWTKTDNYYLVSTMQPTSPSFIPGSVTQSIKLANMTAQDAMSMLSESMQRFVKAEPNGSYVIVTAGPRLTERIIADLRSFDMTPKQVLLQSKIVVMEEGDLLNMGVEWSWPTVRVGMFASDFQDEVASDFDTSGKGIWGVQMGYSLGNTFTNALTMGLNLLQENDTAQMIASPSTMAQDGKLATMGVMTEEYYMLTPDLGGTQVFSQSELETITSGVKLDITPHISDQNDIVLEIAVELSDSQPSGRVSRLPVVTRRTATNTVRVRNGGSAVIAGLNENRKAEKDTRTPFFSSIPLVGSLFSNTNKQEASRDVAIFVTATIIKDQRPAAAAIPAPVPPVNSANPAYPPSMGSMNDFAPGNTNPAPRATVPETQYNTPNVNPPGSYDSFQAELRRTIAEQRRINNATYDN